MNEFQAFERALNQEGYVYIQTRDGDIYLYDASKKIEFPDFESMESHALNQYELAFEFIYDRKGYESNLGDSTFIKSIRLNSIKAIQAFKNVNL